MSTVRSSMGSPRVHIRWMIRRDMPEVVAIEQQSFDLPWSEDEFLRVLRQRNCIGMVAEQAERVVGFMIYELHKYRLEILNFAVHPAHRHEGIGAQMVEKLKGKLSAHRRTRIVLMARESNLTAQLFYRAVGFRATEVVRDYYEDTAEDGYLFQYALERCDPAETSDPKPHHNRIARHLGHGA